MATRETILFYSQTLLSVARSSPRRVLEVCESLIATKELATYSSIKSLAVMIAKDDADGIEEVKTGAESERILKEAFLMVTLKQFLKLLQS